MIVSDPDCEAVALCLDCLLPVQDKWVSYRTERKYTIQTVTCVHIRNIESVFTHNTYQ